MHIRLISTLRIALIVLLFAHISSPAQVLDCPTEEEVRTRAADGFYLPGATIGTVLARIDFFRTHFFFESQLDYLPTLEFREPGTGRVAHSSYGTAMIAFDGASARSLDEIESFLRDHGLVIVASDDGIGCRMFAGYGLALVTISREKATTMPALIPVQNETELLLRIWISDLLLDPRITSASPDLTFSL